MAQHKQTAIEVVEAGLSTNSAAFSIDFTDSLEVEDFIVAVREVLRDAKQWQAFRSKP